MSDASGFELGRFSEAQAQKHAGFADALRELRAGQKTTHWIWYVFPQLRGLGSSPMAVRYGLDGVDEAFAYLRDPVLAQRLAVAVSAAREHVAPARQRTEAVPVDVLMGTDIDAQKLVSCLTLFSAVARAADARQPDAQLTALAADAQAILEVAVGQGYPRCAFTAQRLAAAGIAAG
jgi:uncharacterized protein (DUF1810 family)